MILLYFGGLLQRTVENQLVWREMSWWLREISGKLDEISGNWVNLAANRSVRLEMKFIPVEFLFFSCSKEKIKEFV